MARFYASIQGNRGEATRMGHGSIAGHIRGWNVGIRVAGHGRKDGDVFEVFLTSGSSGQYREQYIGTFALADDGTPARV